MLTMIGKRLMFAIPSLIGVVIVTFLLTRALPGDDDGRRIAAGVLHGIGAGLRLLFPARLVAGAARPSRRVLQRAADGDRFLSDRHPDRARPGGVPFRVQPVAAAGADAGGVL